MPNAPAGQRIYAIGDIHGRADLLRVLLDKIAADRATCPLPTQLIFLGDYIDRGLESRRVIDILLAMNGPPVFLLGNHDQVFRNILRDGDVTYVMQWLRVGGREAALSYGVMPPFPNAKPEVVDAFVEKLQTTVPAEHCRFFNNLKSSITLGDYFFCHAGVRPDVPLAEQTEEDMAWIRGDFLSTTTAFEKIIVHGHTIVEQPDVRRNRIGIDTGAYATGVLTALVLEGDKQWFLQTA
jgi:serine/threonine protein phosphatase 1